MWSVDSTHNSLITTGNAGDKPARVKGTLRHSLGSYELPEQTLQPGESIWLNVRELIQNQIPDREGKTIPLNITSGVYEFDQVDDDMVGSLYEGKLILDSTYGRATYGCANCCGYDALGLAPNPFGIDVGFSGQDQIYVENSCTGAITTRTSYGFNWSTGSSTIAGVSSSGLVSAFSPGQTSSSASISLRTPGVWNCPQQVQQVANTVNSKPKISGVLPGRGLIGNNVDVRILGTGLSGSGLTVSAGSGITVTTNSSSATEIRATFAIASDAMAGNHTVTVTVGGQTSSGATFYVQIPTKMVRDTTYGENGLGSLIVIGPSGTVFDRWGQVVVTNRCGVYRNIGYLLLDQADAVIQGDYIIREKFSNYSTTVPGLEVPPQRDNSIPSYQLNLGDTQGFLTIGPACPGANDNESFDQEHTIVIGSKSYPLTLRNRISRGFFNGTARVDVTIITP